MKGRKFWQLRGLTDGDLEVELRSLLAAGHRIEARIVAHLAEVEARRLHLRDAQTSLFAYCLKRLGLSEMEAFYRITAARLAQRYPVIFELLEQGQVHLTGICALRHHITLENHAELLQAISGKSKRQIEQLLAARFPRADVPQRLQRLPQLEPLSPERYRLQLTISRELKEKLELARDLISHANPSGDLGIVLERGLDLLIEKAMSRRFGATRQRAGAAAPAALQRNVNADPQAGADPQASTEPQTGADARAGADARTGTLAQAGADARTGTLAQADGVPPPDALAQDTDARAGARARKKVAPAQRRAERSDRPTGGMGESKRRQHIAMSVRREVLKRDGLQCGFVGPDGTRCGARAFLQLDHELAWAKGGADELGNLRFRCRAHNRLLAEMAYGSHHVAQAISRARR